MVADVDVVVDDALDVGLQWTRLFRSILLGKYGSIVYSGCDRKTRRCATGSRRDENMVINKLGGQSKTAVAWCCF